MANETFGLVWDQSGEREYELGVSKVVLFPMGSSGYEAGVAWNGCTSIEENPDGADINDIWADNIKYASFQSPENQKGTIKAYMFPDEFYPCNGMVTPDGMPGLSYSGQARKSFGLCYRTEIGTDTNEKYGYKLHFLYNCKVKPSSRAHNTKNENPDPEEMSWEYSSTPVPVAGVDGVEYTSIAEVKSTDFTEAQMLALEKVVYGFESTASRLPAPGELQTILAAAASNTQQGTNP